MNGMAMPDWAYMLTDRDRHQLGGLLAVTDPGEQQELLLNNAEGNCHTRHYQMVKRVLFSKHGNGPFRPQLPPKDIQLPVVPTRNDEVRTGWAAEDGKPEATWGDLYAEVQDSRVEGWERVVRAFEEDPADLAKAWAYLDNHPAFWEFHARDGDVFLEDRIHESRLEDSRAISRALDVTVQKVCPDTGRVEDDEARNTQTKVWIELGQFGWPTECALCCELKTIATDNQGRTLACQHPNSHYHDYRLDCGGWTMEEAYITAAIYVHTAYGNDRRVVAALARGEGWEDE